MKSLKLHRSGASTHRNVVTRRQLNLRYNFYTAGYRLLHYSSPASWRLYITSITQPDTCFYITTAPPVGGFTLQALHSRIQAFTLQQPRQPEALHYKLYTAGYRLLHYNSPASRRLYLKSFTQPDVGFYITTAPLVEGLYITSYFTYITLTTQKETTDHYNEELPLSSKLGQVSAMSSITSYVKDSLSKLNSTQFSEVQILISLIALSCLSSLQLDTGPSF
ncbi:hypothetical protein KY290_016980 [Solanum tuberosum]|uniref:Uncharacterized protein n=1 Tax=Solanum tuberosum TaxID=4113 RepID=A0ABQ7VA14_SOLTU|nr:hypothetical protein KY290_016980 [Solanum tuberosum]